MDHKEIEEADIAYLDEYLEAFYEEQVEPKIAAARKILLLILDFRNLEYLLDHDSLMGTVTRVLQEEYKKSMELSIYLLCCFYILSNYQANHEFLLQNKTGDTTMKIIEYQIHRFDIRMQDYFEKDKQIDELPARSQPAARTDLEKEVKKLNKMILKQDKVLYIAFNTLLNLADDPKVEKKMVKRNIVGLLVRMLERNNGDLLVNTLYFLKKLSIIADNKDQMIEEGLIDRMPRFFKQSNEPLMHLALRLLINLSFDKKAKQLIISKGILPLIVDLLNHNQLRLLVLIELYLLSTESSLRSAFALTECPKLIYKLIIHFPEPIVGRELIALGINLAANTRCANIFTEDDQLDHLIQRAFKSGDILLFKMIRNISQYSDSIDTKDSLKAYAPEVIKLSKSKKVNDDLKVELFGILSSIQLGDEWAERLRDNSFLEFIAAHLGLGYVEDDLVLETICLVGKMAENDKCLEIIAKSKLLKLILEAFFEKMDDDEYSYQVMFIIYRLFFKDLVTDELLSNHKLIDFCIEALSSKNLRIRRLVSDINDLIMEFDPSLAERIKSKKFYLHNQEWIESMEQFEDNMNWNRYMAEGGYQWEDDGYAHGLDPRIWESDSDLE